MVVELFENFNSRDHEQFVQKTALTVDVNYEKVKHILPQRVINLLTDDLLCIICQKKLGFEFQKTDNRKVFMNMPSKVACRWEHLQKIKKL